MTVYDVLQLGLFVLVLTALVKPVGLYLAATFGPRPPLARVFGWLERALYRIAGVDAATPMTWRAYAAALLVFNLLGIAAVFALMMAQGLAPLNPQGFAGTSWHLALNTAVSFVTNTNWQAYAGESTLSYLTQMLALAVQNFLSAAVGLAVAVALARGVAARGSDGAIGNFWADLVRGLIYVLLPGALLLAVVLVGEGVVQTFAPYLTVRTLEGAPQILAFGPVASQMAIKMLGTNGGGFFNANAAHPFENPTPFSNFIQMLAILILPAGLTYAYGVMTGARRHGWVLYGTMLALFLTLTGWSLWSEYGFGTMEGKETRFGIFGSALFASVTTAASCGAVNAAHSSLSPLTGGVAMINMMLGEIVFGGVGAGLYGMFLFVALTVFIAGLMVGRTPEYLGKRIEAREMTLVILAVVAPCAAILLGSAGSLLWPAALASLSAKGPHGFSEVLYAFTSAAANNGSAFAGLNANTPYYNVALSLAMLIGRFGIIVPVLGVAGSLARKRTTPPSPGTFPVDTALFAGLLIAVILVVGALTFVPALALGPVVEHVLLFDGRTF